MVASVRVACLDARALRRASIAPLIARAKKETYSCHFLDEFLSGFI
jgi:hypothetical protein